MLNAIRIYLFLIIIFSFAFQSCDDDSNPIENHDDGSLHIEGQIFKFNGEYNKVYSYCSYPPDSLQTTESEIGEDGYFELNIPLPSEDQLSVYSPLNDVAVINGDSSIFIDSISFTDNSLKYLRYDLFVQSNNRIAYSLPVNPAKITDNGQFPAVGDYYISYYFFNSKTKIQGYFKWRTVSLNSSHEVITEFNISTEVGWNRVITKFTGEDENIATYEVTDTDTVGGDFIIGASNSFSNTVRRL